jgi:hypothetical protein
MTIHRDLPLDRSNSFDLPIGVAGDAFDPVLRIRSDEVPFLGADDDVERMTFDLPPGVPLPGRGDVLYLSSTSAWAVDTVVFERRAGGRMAVQLWLVYVGAARAARPEQCGRLH